ncbi:MAG: hypothetical protein U0Z53_15165 [Blastocatellia bacterium]
MSVLDRLLALGERLLTIDAEMRRQGEIVNEMKQKTDRLIDLMQDTRERLARLEATRDADRAQLAAEVARFRAEYERAQLKLSALLPAPPDFSSDE